MTPLSFIVIAVVDIFLCPTNTHAKRGAIRHPFVVVRFGLCKMKSQRMNFNLSSDELKNNDVE